MKKIVLGVLILLLTSLRLAAQGVTSIPYSFGFEASESAELQNWHLNPGPNAALCADQWVVGGSIYRGGVQSMYISDNSGRSTHFGGQNSTNPQHCIQFAYRDFQLPTGNYYISFDYICPANNVILRAGMEQWVDTLGQFNPSEKAQKLEAVVDAGTGVMWPKGLSTPKVNLGGEPTWQNASWSIFVTNPALSDPLVNNYTTYRIYFAWYSTAEWNDSIRSISAAIDNIQITDARCTRVEELSVQVYSCDEVEVSWPSTGADRYQIEYSEAGENQWLQRPVNPGSGERISVLLDGMTDGDYDFRVRSRCVIERVAEPGVFDTVFSPYTYLSNYNIFCPDQHCINYVNLTDTNTAVCTYGTTNSGGYAATWQLAYQNQGVIDYGHQSINSRHTVCWDTLAYDSITNYQLRKVPVGAKASVRLGNWDWNYGAEAVTYKFTVDPNNSILLLNYAIVLEDPSSHSADEMPRFVLKIFDENDNLIDPDCGVVDLCPLDKSAGWITIQSGQYSYESVVYKDWTTLGLNLDAYAGQTLKVSVATYDCFLSAHYGYAYFTMDCASAHIQNTSCGAEQSMSVSAPLGFDYKWMETKTGRVRSTERTITIGLQDATDWTCRLTSKENKNCFFDLSVNTLPRFPKAMFNWRLESNNCENRVVFENKSCILVNHDGKTEYVDDDCDRYLWEFGYDGLQTTEKNPSAIYYPEEGGDFTVTLTGKIGNGQGACMSDTTITIHLDPVGDIDMGTVDTTICSTDYVELYGDVYFQKGTYNIDKQLPSGCRFKAILNLDVLEASETVLNADSICFGDSLFVGGDWFYAKKAGKQQLSLLLKNYIGCDSTVVFPIFVHDEILPTISVLPIEEGREKAELTLGGSGWTHYTVNGEPHSEMVLLLDADNYVFEFFNDYGCSLIVTEELSGCISNMVYQRWNDVLSIRKSERPDYQFQWFQWTFDGQDIVGANDSYYYAQDGLKDGIYTCRVILSNGEEGETCAFRPTLKPVQNAPKVQKVVRNNAIYIVREGVTYTMFGGKIQ